MTLTPQEYQALDQALQRLGAFSGLLAHDLNNLLSGVVGYTSFAKMKSPDGRILQDLEAIERSTGMIVDLTRKLMVLSPHRRFDTKPVSLAVVLQETLETFTPRLPPQCQLKYQPAHTALQARLDGAGIRQALHAILDNALAALPKRGGLIEIACVENHPTATDLQMRLRARATCACITVRDNGCGMRPEVFHQCLLPLYSSRSPRKGAGLGLSLAYHLIAAHGGDLLIESEPEKGTQVSIYLPLLTPAPATP